MWIRPTLVRSTQNNQTIYCIAAFLPQKISNNFVKAERKREVELSKRIFKWIPKASPGELGWDLPRFVNASTSDELPALLKKSIIRKETKRSTLAKGFINKLKTNIQSKYNFTLFPNGNFSCTKDFYVFIYSMRKKCIAQSLNDMFLIKGHSSWRCFFARFSLKPFADLKFSLKIFIDLNFYQLLAFNDFLYPRFNS